MIRLNTSLTVRLPNMSVHLSISYDRRGNTSGTRFRIGESAETAKCSGKYKINKRITIEHHKRMKYKRKPEIMCIKKCREKTKMQSLRHSVTSVSLKMRVLR